MAETKSASTGSVMFDLYKLMALLVEVAQSQRDAARDLRTAQSAQIQNSIQSQAETQRNAALVGLIVGVVCDDEIRESGTPEKAQKIRDLCVENNWIPISMKDDWLTVFGDGVTKKTPVAP